MRRELICTAPSTPPQLHVRSVARPRPGAGQVLVRVEATAVNPIDLKRAGGYGRRLLALKGAAQFPLVLGNDVAGVVDQVGAGVTRFQPGQPVFGLLATDGRGGAHASHVVVAEGLLMAAPAGSAATDLATLPYCFTTLWLAVQAAGLRADNAAGKRVLVSGATGALGRLSRQLLGAWGCTLTPIDRRTTDVAALPADFDVVLNFGAWASEAMLVGKLGPQALGYATTVHPLMANFDRLGWLRGAVASLRDWKAMQSAARVRSAHARYGWTVFRPDRAALAALEEGVQHGRFSLPVGIARPFDEAAAAFHHVAQGRPGRALLLPP